MHAAAIYQANKIREKFLVFGASFTKFIDLILTFLGIMHKNGCPHYFYCKGLSGLFYTE
jgi:hypothetical protein